MISVDTSAPEGHELTLVQEIAKYLSSSGIHATVHPSGHGRANLVARLSADTSKDDPLVLHASLDVAPCAQRRWTAGSHALVEHDGVLTGCGIAEGKGVAALMIAALLEMKDAKLRRDVLLILTSDGLGNGDAGISHLWSVLPDLPERAVVLTPGAWSDADDDGKARFLGAQFNARTTMHITLRAHGDALGPAQTSSTSSSARLLRALGRVETHRFPYHGSPDVKAQLSSLAAVHAIPENPPDDGTLFPAADVLTRTTCRVTSVDLAPVPLSTSSATVTCHLVPPDEPSQIAWFMVDVVKDPRVVVERAKEPAVKELEPRADVQAALAAASPVPTVWMRSPSSPEARKMRAHGWDVYGVGFMPLTRAEWASAYGSDASVHVRAFEQAASVVTNAVRNLALLK